MNQKVFPQWKCIWFVIAFVLGVFPVFTTAQELKQPNHEELERIKNPPASPQELWDRILQWMELRSENATRFDIERLTGLTFTHVTKHDVLPLGFVDVSHVSQNLPVLGLTIVSFSQSTKATAINFSWTPQEAGSSPACVPFAKAAKDLGKLDWMPANLRKNSGLPTFSLFLQRANLDNLNAGISTGNNIPSNVQLFVPDPKNECVLGMNMLITVSR